MAKKKDNLVRSYSIFRCENYIEVPEEYLEDVDSRLYEVNGHNIQLSLSLGIAIFPEDSEDMEALLQNTDKAMYGARNTYCFYSK